MPEIKIFEKVKLINYVDPNLIGDNDITTMTVLVKLGKNIFIDRKSFVRHIQCHHSDILSVNFNNCNENLLKKVKKSKRNKGTKKSKKSFYNQITMKIRSSDKIDDVNVVNMKLFNEGTIQMTGVKSIAEFNNAMTRFINTLTRKHVEYNSIEEKFERVELYKGDIEVCDFRIVLLNIKHDSGYPVNRNKLFELLTIMGEYTSYNPETYPGVIWEHNVDGKKMTIMVFAKGKMTISTKFFNKKTLNKMLKLADDFFSDSKIRTIIEQKTNVYENLKEFINKKDLG